MLLNRQHEEDGRRRHRKGGRNIGRRHYEGVEESPALTLRSRDSDLLLERQHELETAHQALTEASRGEGRILVVEGPAGIGKTRLLEAVAHMAVDAGFEVHGARGDDLETAFAYGVLRQLLAPALAQLDPADRAVVLEGPASFLASLVEGTAGPPSSGLGSEGLGAAYGLYQLIQDLAERRPRLLCVDDVHWADLPSLHALGFVARRLADLPILMLLASRRSVDGPAKDVLARFDSLAGSRRATPAPLGEEAVTTLALAVLDPDLDAGVCRRLWQVTGGNPFLVRELLAGLRADRELQELPHLETSDIERYVPERVGRSVLRRLADVGDQAVKLADAVAALGEAPLQEAAQLAGLGELEAVTAADRLVAADVLAPGAYLRFTHPMLREAVRAHIPPARRSLAHARAARLLSDRGAPLERVAAQLLEALPRRDPWVVDTLVAAAVRERQRGSPETAALLLARALAEPPPPGRQAGVTLALGRAQAESGHPDAVATAQQALALAKEPAEEAEARLHLARTLGLAGDFWSAVDLLDEQSSAQTALDPELALQLEAELLGSARLDARTRDEALARLDQLAPQALPPRPTSVVLLANLALTALERTESPEKVAELAQLALSGHWLIESGSFQFAYAGEALLFIDRLEEAKRACDAAADVAHRWGWATAVVYGLRSNVNLRRGAVADAEADARISDRLCGELAARGLPALGRPFGRAHLANALMVRGEWDEAGRMLADAKPDERAEDNPFYLECRGWFRLAQNDAAAALEDFLACGRSLAGRGGVDAPSLLPWRSHAALALLQLSDEPRAHELAAQELDLATKQQVAGAIGQALIAIGIIEGGEDGIRRLQDAVNILAGSPRVLTRVRALTELGSMLRRNRRRQPARGFLVDALDLAHRHGATALADQAREELVIAGGRPRRAATTGLDALTPGERRVAQLVAQGLTNRQIASRLFVSARTVTTHLTHIYQKLGPVSRAELSAMLKESI